MKKFLKVLFISFIALVLVCILLLTALVYVLDHPKIDGLNNDYSAYFIDDSTKLPIKDLIIRAVFPKISSVTDSNGYFIIKKPKEGIMELIIEGAVYRDTVLTLWRHPEGGGGRRFLGEKIYLKSK